MQSMVGSYNNIGDNGNGNSNSGIKGQTKGDIS